MMKIKFAIGVGLILSLLTACGSDDNKDVTTSNKSSNTYATQTITETEDTLIKPETVAEYLNDTGLDEFGLFSFNEEMNAFQFFVTDGGLAMEIGNISTTNGTLDSWQGLTSCFDDLCLDIQDMLGDGYSVMIMNPSNKENILYWVMDGETMYDFTTE